MATYYELLDVFRAALDNMRDSIQIKDAAGNAVFENRAALCANRTPERPNFPQFFETIKLPYGYRMEVEKIEDSDIVRRGFDAMPDIVWMAQPDGYIELFSNSLEIFTGLPMGEVLGQGWYVIVHPDDLERTKLIWMNSLTTIQPYNIEYLQTELTSGLLVERDLYMTLRETSPSGLAIVQISTS